MIDLLSEYYLHIKVIHIIAVISWMAGLLYLPRLYVYHIENMDKNISAIFEIMERRLLKAIMTPAMIISWLCGICMAVIPGVVVWSDIWPWVKGLSVILMTLCHFWLAQERYKFMHKTNRLTSRHYRMINEIPTILMIVIVSAVVLKF